MWKSLTSLCFVSALWSNGVSGRCRGGIRIKEYTRAEESKRVGVEYSNLFYQPLTLQGQRSLSPNCRGLYYKQRILIVQTYWPSREKLQVSLVPMKFEQHSMSQVVLWFWCPSSYPDCTFIQL